MNRLTQTAMVLLVNATVFAGMANATMILVDFGGNVADPVNPNWNAAVSPSGATDLIDSTGANTGINLSFGGDDSLSTSSNTDGWTDRTEEPAWVNGDLNPLNDRLFLSNNESATMTLSGLDPNTSYNIELAAAFQAGGGGAGQNPGFYNLVDVNGTDANGKGVDAVNALDDSLLTFDSGEGGFAWTVRTGQGDWEEGWLGWANTIPDVNGELILEISTSSNSLSRIALNAMQIEFVSESGTTPGSPAVPEPTTMALAALSGLVVMVRRRRGA